MPSGIQSKHVWWGMLMGCAGRWSEDGAVVLGACSRGANLDRKIRGDLLEDDI